ncbi:hypothetical protein C499_18004 [Halogeometricum borinquense DSM 11551]|uniref:Uncharacterized protein n=2 Tax=Halogeometricum borinquense TaxID=60847 RepID=E4NPH9_HALBP|nr:hypothetical protein [Halogeometricum borinquense]ADQ67649.1 hypothetical protein Hbor_20840 [Halogeometricum borinquense DSM 11551]ELY23670.1 hypothetical protein C499_18004 [Halogeometricum borinquense DSM 11551]RYJ13406.1 hypothetical protein ELS19_05125 [Halogeometricum borinquense]
MKSDRRAESRARSDRRGQAHTLEAIAASILLLSSIAFALQVTAVTPLTGSTSNQRIEDHQSTLAEDVLASQSANETLKAGLLYWNESERNWHGAQWDGYHDGAPENISLGQALNDALLDRGVAYNLNVYFWRNDQRIREQVVYLGEPSDHASVATWTVTLYDDDRLRDADGNLTATTLSDAEDAYFAPDIEPDGAVYNVVVVEVVTWRM